MQDDPLDLNERITSKEFGQMSLATATAKELVMDMLRRLPDDVTLEQIQYSIFMLEKAVLAQEAIAEGDVYTHEEVKEIIRAKWLTE
jgi:hypothetical protein